MSEAPSTQTPPQPAPDTTAQTAIDAELQSRLFGDEFVEAPSSDSATKKDDPKPGSTPSGGPEGSPQSTKRLLADKYETQEALEDGYRNALTERNTIKRERDQFERELTALRGQLQQPSTSKPAGSTPGESPSAGEILKDPQVQTLLQEVQYFGGDARVKEVEDLLKRFESKSSAPATSVSDEALTLAQNHFLEAYPEFKDEATAKAFADFTQEVAGKVDPMAHLELLRSAFMHRSETDRFDKAIAEARKDERAKVVEERDKHWKSVISSNNLTIGATAPAESGPSGVQAQQVQYFGMSD